MLNNFSELIADHSRTYHLATPPIPVWHSNYGSLGECVPGKGLVTPLRQRASVRAILRDDKRNKINMIRRFEKYAPRVVQAAVMGVLGSGGWAGGAAMAAISNYDGIVSARGSGALQDVWMSMTAAQTPVTTSWYDLMNFTSWQPQTNQGYTAIVNGGTAGSVQDATSNGSWLTNPAGSNKKYIVSCGLTVSSITGFSLAMLYDQLWCGQMSITTNATVAPATPLAVTRYANTTPGNADYAGGNQLQFTMANTLTYTVNPSVTTTYVDGNGNTGKTTVFFPPATGALINRIVGNTTYNTANVITSTPFTSLTNAGTPGIKTFTQFVVAGGTVTSGAFNAKIVRPLIIMPFIAAASYIEQDATLNIGNMVELRNVSQVCGCLGWNAFSNGTTAVSMSAFLRMVEG
jgi:hypothetical protein